MMVGSCFAENIGQHLLHELPEGNVCVNPFGVLYNPMSIAKVLSPSQWDGIANDTFLGHDGRWHNWNGTSKLSAETEEECRRKTADAVMQTRDFLRHTDLLCITFGTTRCYRHNDLIVANCHKEPQACFTEVEPSLDEIRQVWQGVLEELRVLNPRMQVMFTVSPFRYRKYGFHESQIQKAKLLLFTEGRTYFPSYEIMMDELRDYRFYDTDMLHPSAQAVEIIYDRFKDWCFDDELKAVADENLKKYKRSQHKELIK